METLKSYDILFLVILTEQELTYGEISTISYVEPESGESYEQVPLKPLSGQPIGYESVAENPPIDTVGITIPEPVPAL
jgi:hypothetical protein